MTGPWEIKPKNIGLNASIAMENSVEMQSLLLDGRPPESCSKEELIEGIKAFAKVSAELREEVRAYKQSLDVLGQINVEILEENTELKQRADLHHRACYYCGEACNPLAGNPGFWPVVVCFKEEPGVPKACHSACVSARLSENAALRERLEIAHAYDGEGNKVPFPGDGPDGIECRDATIKHLSESNEHLRGILRKIDTLFGAIAHGDEKHRAWLKEKIDKHFGGEDDGLR